jgi:hypothetical protein
LRVLAALVLVIGVVLIGMVARGEFGPSASLPVRASARPSPSSATATPVSTASRAVTVTLTEQDLTKAARDYTPLTVSGITVTDPKVRLEPGRLTLTATGRAFIFSGPVVVVASPLVTNGVATAKIETATFAGISLSESAKQDVADTFARVLATNIPAGMRVTSLTVNAGSLVVEAAPA